MMGVPPPDRSHPRFPQGHVLGTARGRFSVYVVSPHSAPLEVDLPRHDFLTAPADFTVTASAPNGLTLTEGHMTALMPGVVLEDGSLTVRSNGLTYDYDPVDFSRGGADYWMWNALAIQ